MYFAHSGYGKVFEIFKRVKKFEGKIMAISKDKVRVAAVGDVHCTKASEGLLQPLFAQINQTADILALCGDLTDYGLPDEAKVLVKELSVLRIPIVAVLGNHDYESDQAEEVKKILCDSGVKVLDGDAVEIEGISFAGVKGFAGGFGRGALGAWGESAIKAFVQEVLNEAMKLEAGLARLRTENKIALLHYSPIQQTVEGEPVDIYPFLGSSRLEEPLYRYPVTAVFHGHAHSGTPEGCTRNNIPVYNVALPLMRRTFESRPFRLLEIPMRGDAAPTDLVEPRKMATAQ
jgi:Icc-related predicted phosphoesterase